MSLEPMNDFEIDNKIFVLKIFKLQVVKIFEPYIRSNIPAMIAGYCMPRLNTYETQKTKIICRDWYKYDTHFP
jgi:hypothetical protein